MKPAPEWRIFRLYFNSLNNITQMAEVSLINQNLYYKLQILKFVT